jgi:hypothetical protein
VLSTAGIMVEEAFQWVWRRLAGDGQARLWHKLAGHIWVGAFFTATHPIFFYPAMRQGPETKETVPFDVVTGMGLSMAGGLLAVEGRVGDAGYGRWGLIVNAGEAGSPGIV